VALALWHVLAVVAESSRRGLTPSLGARIVNLVDDFLWHATGASIPASGSPAAEHP
jgi:hypothetical protein